MDPVELNSVDYLAAHFDRTWLECATPDELRAHARQLFENRDLMLTSDPKEYYRIRRCFSLLIAQKCGQKQRCSE
jgi:hypothetical protein